MSFYQDAARDWKCIKEDYSGIPIRVPKGGVAWLQIQVDLYSDDFFGHRRDVMQYVKKGYYSFQHIPTSVLEYFQDFIKHWFWPCRDGRRIYLCPVPQLPIDRREGFLYISVASAFSMECSSFSHMSVVDALLQERCSMEHFKGVPGILPTMSGREKHQHRRKLVREYMRKGLL